MNKIILTFFVLIFMNSCNQSPSQEKREYLIQPGEWLDRKNNTPRFSVRKDMLAFYNNGTFTGDDIYHYVVIETDGGKTLLLNGVRDTLEYRILKKNDTLINLQIDNQIFEYKWSQAIQFKLITDF